MKHQYSKTNKSNFRLWNLWSKFKLLSLFLLFTAFTLQAQEIIGDCRTCVDGIDNNGNGLIDGADPACQNLVVDCPGFSLPSLCSPRGGTRADIISTQTRYRDAGGAAVTFTIPNNASRAIVYISSHNGVTTFDPTDTQNLADEDFITVNAVLNFQNNTSTGQLNYTSDTNPVADSPGMTLFGWQNVAFGSLVSTGALAGHDVTPLLNNVNFSVSGNTLTITESNTAIRSSYHVEFTSALTRSLVSNGFEGRFLALGTAAVNKNLSIPIPANTNIISISAKGTNGRSNNDSDGGTEEGFSVMHFLMDLDAQTTDGYVTVVNGGDLQYRSTYVVNDHSTASNARLVTVATGDFTGKSIVAGGQGLYNPSVYILGGNLIIERDDDYASDYEDTYVIEFFRRVPEPMSAEFLNTQTLFVAKGTAINTPAASDRTFNIPAGTNFIYFKQAANSPNSNPNPAGSHNENAQAAYAVIDLKAETANGYYWQQVGFNSPGTPPSTTGRRDDNFVFRGLPINGINPKTHVNTVGKQFGSDYNIFFTLSADKTQLTVRNNVSNGVNINHQIVMTADFYGSRPDLAVDPNNISFNSSDCATVTVNMQMCNPGAGNSPQGIPVSFYVGNPTTDVTAVRVHTGNFGVAVPVGGCGNFSFTFGLGAFANNLNEVQLYMVINDNGSYAPLNTAGITFALNTLQNQNTNFIECDYNNNLIQKKITISNCQLVQPDVNVTLINTPVNGNVFINDSDFGASPLTLTSVNGNSFTIGTPITLPSGGTLTFTGSATTGTYIYTPPTGFTGTDTFTYTACNSAGFCGTTEVNIEVYQVNASNNPPVANNDNIQLFQNTTITGSLITNDFDPDSDLIGNVTIIGTVPNGLVVNPDDTYTYTPPTDFVGVVSFVYEVCDNASPTPACSQATATINVYPTTAGLDPPYAQDDANNGNVDEILSGNVLLNDFDPNSPAQILTVTPQTATTITGGTVSINVAGVYQFTPTPGFTGPTNFTYQVCNDSPTNAFCDVATVYLIIQPDAPIPQADINNTLMNTPVSGNVLTNDQDPQGLSLTVSTGTVITSNGTIVFNTDGTYTYTPNFGFQGEDIVTYEVCNSAGACQTATLTIQVQQQLPASNNAPIANDDVGQTIAGVTLSGNVILNDFDRDLGQTLTVSEVNGVPGNVGTPTAITGGDLTLNADGTYSFVPTAGFVGNTSFEYTVCDNAPTASCQTATVNITVYEIPNVPPANYAPFAQDDAAFVYQSTTGPATPVGGNVLANDSDPEGGVLTVVAVASPTDILAADGITVIGTYTIDATGNYVFTPTVGYTGPASFTYQVCDDGSPALCDIATVYLTVQAASPLPPISRNDLANTLLDTPVTGTILVNDLDLFGLRFVRNPNTPPTIPPNNGAVVFNSDGTYTYTPDAGYEGPDNFTYEICNSAGLCSQSRVFINVVNAVAGSNNVPVVQNDFAETLQDENVSGNVLSNDFDYDGNTLLVTQINGVAFTSGSPITLTNGTLTMNSDGTYIFDPDPAFAGIQTFTYQTCDDGNPAECATATVAFTVYPTGTLNLPFAQNDAYVTYLSNPLSSNVLVNDSNLGTVTSLNIITPPSNGVISGINIDGTFTYTPNPSYFGPDYFVYRVCNANGCAVATASILILNANGPLPLDLLFFTAEKQDESVKVYWTTINEIEVSHFEIERSADGQNFTKIGQIDARNRGTEISDYVFIDAQPLKGDNYYRFKQVEQNGNTLYSPLAYLYFEQLLTWNVYPNPTVDYINIQLNSEVKDVQIRLTDAKGRLLQAYSTDTDEAGKLRINLKSLQAGSYFIQINADTRKFNKVIIKY